MALLNQMITTKRLKEFVDEFVRIRNEEQEEQAQWDVWLHRIFNQSFADFRKSLQENKQTAAPTLDEAKNIAVESKSIFESFVTCDMRANRR